MANFHFHFDTLTGIGSTVTPPAILCPAGGAGAPGRLLRELPKPLVATPAQLLGAALSAGVYPAGAILTEAAWRVASLKATAQEDDDAESFDRGHWITTPLVARCDLPDRGFLTSLFGGAATALVAARIGVTNFMSLERYQAAVHPPAITWRSAHENLRPDFLSQLGGAFQTWQSKGRAGASYDGATAAVAAALQGALLQANAVQAVNGRAPNAHVAVLAHAGTDAGGGSFPWHISVVDPGTGEPSRLTPEQQDAIYREYYRPWLALIELQRSEATLVSVGGASFTVVPVSGSATAVGIDALLVEILHTVGEEAGALSAAIDEVLAGGYANNGAGSFINPNGLYVDEVPPPARA